MDPIRVGIVGANPDRGWAVRAHIPALQALPDFRITAVGTTRSETAREAARRFGVEHAHTDPRELAENPEVDLVAVTVKAPAHAAVIRPALAAGKHVYCEWPLTGHLAGAQELAELAATAGVHHAVGLQARYAPAIVGARRLIAEGYVGQVISVTVYAARGLRAGGTVPGWAAYTLDDRNGAGMLGIGGGHTLDAVEYLVGGFADVSARLAIRHPHAKVAETGVGVESTGPDHLLFDAVTREDVLVSAHLHDAKVTDARTRIEISGTAGDLAIVSGEYGAGGVQMSELHLLGARDGSSWTDLPGEDPLSATTFDVEAGNVARVYAALAQDIRTGAHTVPDFTHGVHAHRLLDAVRRSADAGARVHLR
ncbi:Gfo/Idh/MocA family protein [Nocardia alni]|uniref:Gfo/Idh/MocA family protein n=1 Tax=Nocardia alni TaxID=2815723 RepID=UPI001C219554|nr:Gfo/Idh/MocA family oxidoreductase [Nocardia alni]